MDRTSSIRKPQGPPFINTATAERKVPMTQKKLTPSEFIALAASIESTVQCSVQVLSHGRMTITMRPEDANESVITITTQVQSDGSATHLYEAEKPAPVTRKNYFPVLNDALASEGLVKVWPMGKSLAYGETFSFTFDDGTQNGHFVSIYRDETGRYERPVHYAR
jgi:hypothetical protein